MFYGEFSNLLKNAKDVLINPHQAILLILIFYFRTHFQARVTDYTIWSFLLRWS
jgi:hypothetical protein